MKSPTHNVLALVLAIVAAATTLTITQGSPVTKDEAALPPPSLLLVHPPNSKK
jgi:hypothetical protein